MDFEFIKTYGLSRSEEITLVQTFVEELWKSMDSLKKSKEDKDTKLARVYSHKIQGSAGMVGLTTLASEAKSINDLIHQNDWNWDSKLDNLINSFPEIQRIAKSFCA
jgi:HPt (histidine-containing phosphotransfer) domain-containing protein